MFQVAENSFTDRRSAILASMARLIIFILELNVQFATESDPTRKRISVSHQGNTRLPTPHQAQLVLTISLESHSGLHRRHVLHVPRSRLWSLRHLPPCAIRPTQAQERAMAGRRLREHDLRNLFAHKQHKQQQQWSSQPPQPRRPHSAT